MWTPALYADLADQLVVVTGGASGIGADIVRAFHAAKSRVIFLDVDDASAGRLSVELAGAQTCEYVHCDVRNIEALRSTFAGILERHGGIGVLINNAARDDRHVLADLEPASWDECLNVNVRHHVFAIQAVAPHMASAGRGAIVNMGSVAWMRGQPAMVGYHAAKAAIAGITRALARELGTSNVRVNSIAPGAVLTERQSRLWLTPEKEAQILAAQALKFRVEGRHVANLALFLASDQSAAITGQTILVDAGFTVN